nr:hypothetical protein CFP56_20962 [Quercus suber]
MCSLQNASEVKQPESRREQTLWSSRAPFCFRQISGRVPARPANIEVRCVGLGHDCAISDSTTLRKCVQSVMLPTQCRGVTHDTCTSGIPEALTGSSFKP